MSNILAYAKANLRPLLIGCVVGLLLGIVL